MKLDYVFAFLWGHESYQHIIRAFKSPIVAYISGGMSHDEPTKEG